MTSKKLGRFDVDGEISASALGPLHRARAEGSPFLLRLVRLRPPLGKADGETLRDAAEAGFGLKHANVAAFVEAVSEGNELGLFFEGNGETLATLQKRALLARKPFPSNVLLRVVLDLAEGVVALGEQSGEAKLHGGVTPETVVVGDDGVARVLDFLPNAAATAEPWARAPRRAAYQSPESFRKEPLSAASDVFSLATLAWELASNRSLFVAASLGEIEKRMLAPSKRADAAKPAGGEVLETKVADVLERALALAPAERPATAADLATQLRDSGAPIASHAEVAAFLRSLTEKPASARTPAPSETKPKSASVASVEPKSLEAKSAPAASVEPKTVDVKSAELISVPAKPAPKPAAPAVKSSPTQLDEALDDLDVVSLHSVKLPPAPPMRRPIPLGKPATTPAPAPVKAASSGEDIDVSFEEAAEPPPPPSQSAKPPSSARPSKPPAPPTSTPTPPTSAPFPLSKSLAPPPLAESAEEEAKPEEAKSEVAKSEEAKPEEAKSEEAKVEAAKSEAKPGEAESEAKPEEAKSEPKPEEAKSEPKPEEAKSEEAKVEAATSAEAKSEEAKPSKEAEGQKPVAAAPARAEQTPEEALRAAVGEPLKPAQSRRAIDAPPPRAAEPKPLVLAPPTLATAADNDAGSGATEGGGKRGKGLVFAGVAAALVAVLAIAFLGGGDEDSPPPAAPATPAATAVEAPAPVVTTAAPAPTPAPTPEPTPAAAETAAPVASASEAPAAAPTPTPAAPPPAATPLAASRPAPASTPKPASAPKPANTAPKGKTTKYIPGGI